MSSEVQHYGGVIYTAPITVADVGEGIKRLGDEPIQRAHRGDHVRCAPRTYRDLGGAVPPGSVKSLM